MRRGLVLVLVTGLIFGGIASAEAKKPRKVSRKAEAEYVAPARFYWAPTGDNIGGVTFPTTAAENFVSIEIKDNTGMPVSGAVGQDPEADGTVATTPFCTKTDKPVPIEGGLPVTVFVFVGPCTDPPGPAFATQGTVVGTFSNLP
jgi:hypothetical protein